MQRARAFFYVAAGIFLLTVSYHLGARTAGAQLNSQVPGAFAGTGSLGIAGNTLIVMTPNGDVYSRDMWSPYTGNQNGELYFWGNFWQGGPVPVTPETWGGLKARYRK